MFVTLTDQSNNSFIVTFTGGSTTCLNCVTYYNTCDCSGIYGNQTLSFDTVLVTGNFTLQTGSSDYGCEVYTTTFGTSTSLPLSLTGGVLSPPDSISTIPESSTIIYTNSDYSYDISENFTSWYLGDAGDNITLIVESDIPIFTCVSSTNLINYQNIGIIGSMGLLGNWTTNGSVNTSTLLSSAALSFYSAYMLTNGFTSF
jgi:hypothetical protein